MKKTSKAQKPIRTAIHGDDYGNKIVIDHFLNMAIINLKLNSEKRLRNIGTLDIPKRILYVTRNSERHLFRSMNAYGFNHYILKEAKLFDHIIINDEKNSWMVSREVMLSKGKFLNFSNSGGFELQLFVTLSDLTENNKKQN